MQPHDIDLLNIFPGPVIRIYPSPARIKDQLLAMASPLQGCYPLRKTFCTLIPESLPCPIGITYTTPWRTGNGPAVSTLTTSRSRHRPQRGRDVSKPSAIRFNMLMIKSTFVRAQPFCKTRPVHSHLARSWRLPGVSFA